jgi:hypothetical protein
MIVSGDECSAKLPSTVIRAAVFADAPPRETSREYHIRRVSMLKVAIFFVNCCHGAPELEKTL